MANGAYDSVLTTVPFSLNTTLPTAPLTSALTVNCGRGARLIVDPVGSVRTVPSVEALIRLNDVTFAPVVVPELVTVNVIVLLVPAVPVRSLPEYEVITRV